MKPRYRYAWAACLVAVVLTSGCASTGKSAETEPPLPEPAPEEAARVEPEPSEAPEPVQEPQAETEPVTPEVEVAVEPQEVEEPEEETGAYGPKTVVVPSTEEETPAQARTLAEAARNARERRGDGDGEPIAVITDETLSEFATGDLTVATEPAATTPRSEDTAGSILDQEEYWRTRVRDARIEWKELTDQITQLEGDVAGLRNRFYAEDDGFYRDSQVKPAWDRALDRLAETQRAVIAAQANVQAVLEEGRQAGALPGWLREGLEYEPTNDDGGRTPSTHEPGEPQVVEEDGGR